MGLGVVVDILPGADLRVEPGEAAGDMVLFFLEKINGDGTSEVSVQQLLALGEQVCSLV